MYHVNMVINGNNIYYLFIQFFFVFGATAPSGTAPPHSRSFYITHNDASHSVGLLWTNDQPIAKTSTGQHTTLTTNIHPPGGIQTPSLSRRAAVDLRLRPRGHWDRHLFVWIYSLHINVIIIIYCKVSFGYLITNFK
jgi:hypothetical protein